MHMDNFLSASTRNFITFSISSLYSYCIDFKSILDATIPMDMHDLRTKDSCTKDSYTKRRCFSRSLYQLFE